MPATTPSGPPSTADRAAGSASMVITISAAVAARAGVAAAQAPSATSGRVGAAVRFHTVRSWPAASTRPAIRLPIRPRPRKATEVMTAPIGYVTGRTETRADLPGGPPYRDRDGGDAGRADPGVGTGHADAGHHRPGPVEHRPGHAAQVRLQLLLVHRVATRPHPGQLLPQDTRVGDRPVRPGLQRVAPVARREVGVAQPGQQRLAHRAAVRGRPLADPGVHPDRLPAV